MKLNFTLYGSNQQEKKVGEIIDLYLSINYFQSNTYIPPHRILKRYFMSGGDAYIAANRVEWDEFELHEQEYESLQKDLITNHGKVYVECDEDIVDIETWESWCYCHKTGAPFEFYSALMKKIREIEHKLEQSSESLDDETKGQLFIQQLELEENIEEIYDEFGYG